MYEIKPDGLPPKSRIFPGSTQARAGTKQNKKAEPREEPKKGSQRMQVRTLTVDELNALQRTPLSPLALANENRLEDGRQPIIMILW